MKKSLVALAVLAVTGSSFAQSNVTVSGKFGFAYEAGQTLGVSKSGLGQTDGNVTFSASENLGGGMKAGASIDIRARGRGAVAGSVDGRDASVFVSGGFGTVTMGAIELGNGIIGLGGADAPTIGLDGASIAAPINADVMLYTSPEFSGMTFSAAVLDNSMGQYGMQSAAVNYSGTLIGLGYAAGPVAVSADFTNFNWNGQVSATATLMDSRTRISASYDLGVAKFGLGYESLKLSSSTAGVASVNQTETIFGVSAPVGSAITVGANVTRSKVDGVLNGTSGTDLGIQYNLSKRTNVQLGYQRVAVDNAATDTTNTRVRLMHSF